MTTSKKFRTALLQWNKLDNKRQMPWKGEKDPYKIWLSEIILQQTRVEQGWAYYERFIERFPTVQQLAAARDEQAFKLWEGLGYYNRCKNLLFTARYITENYNGRFPDSYPDIVALKGVGPYTAAAIASFAFNLPYAVLDGNVFRVLSRVFGIDIPIDSTQGKTLFAELAQETLDDTRAGEFNQAIMDFGATVCKPLAPLCTVCPMRHFCEAYRHGNVNVLPVKQKVLQKKTRWFSWFVLRVNDKMFIRKRGSGDIWENLHEFYLVETPAQPHWNKQELDTLLKNQLAVNNYELENAGPVTSQQLTHQTIKAQVLTLRLPEIPESLREKEWLPYRKVSQLAFPKLLSQWLAGWKL
ncbi:A/G-specific adenine glycosylase [Filimonas effusa]|uniref:Adenine DNA glycosylase n=1 Tax=Filimonas effusa TaxID=2508721 RepID=A0A4Q1D5A4_9BACT|nr:A/G-specific adenine glycosylase [Filimonas effusa]RXK83538.1 A/G-specific adenine glycosylase [Filimonas effusa]